MINNYVVKKINGEEVLFLYFDFSYEMSIDDFRNIKTKIEENIQEFIKKNKISFKGATVLLLSGGILFGSVNLNTPTFSGISMENQLVYETQENMKVDKQYENIIENDYISEVVEEDVSVEDKVEQGQDNVLSNMIIDSGRSNIVEQPSIKSDTDKEEKNVEDFREEIKVEQSDVEQSEVVDNNIYVSVKRNGEIFKIELEEYVIGVVGAEMPASFNIEALKAQSVIARTYALKSISRGNILSDNESTQSYKNNDELRSMWGSSYNTYYNKIKDAVNSTKGEYLTYNGEYIDAVYHSTSNGKTESSINVWGNFYPYLVSVESIYDDINPSYEKTIELSYEDVSSKLNMQVDENVEINILEKTIGDRVASVSIGDKTYTGVELRNMLGLRSADFDIVKTETGVVITTRGYGHGVGLSQYGANGMAKNGFSYKDILKHYYTGVSIGYL